MGHRIFAALPILNITGLKGSKMDEFMPDRKNATIMAFGKPINNRISSNIRTANVVFSHPLHLTIKNRFEKFVVKFLCMKVFGRLLLTQ